MILSKVLSTIKALEEFDKDIISASGNVYDVKVFVSRSVVAKMCIVVILALCNGNILNVVQLGKQQNQDLVPVKCI